MVQYCQHCLKLFWICSFDTTFIVSYTFFNIFNDSLSYKYLFSLSFEPRQINWVFEADVWHIKHKHYNYFYNLGLIFKVLFLFYTLLLLYIERPEILCAIVEYCYNFHKFLHMYYEVILPYDSTSIPWQPQKHIWVTELLCVFPVSSLVVHACDKFSGKCFVKSQRDSCDFSSLYYALLYHEASLPADFSLD